MPRLYGDLLAGRRAQLVDSVGKEAATGNDNLYKRWVPAYQWQWSSGMADFGQIGNFSYVAKMGKPSGLITAVRSEDLWVLGDIYVSLLYSGDVASGDYAIDVSVLPIGESGDLSGSGSTVSATLSPPSGSNLVVTDTVSPFTVDADDDVIFVKLERKTTGDTNAGRWYFLGGMIRFWPSRRV